MKAMAVRILFLMAIFGAASAHAWEPPTIPVGYDAYRQWQRWPEQRIGECAYMRSTYDRRGGNEGADASHFLYQLADDRNVALDVAGPGVMYFARYNHWHGSPWHYVVDGQDYSVQESSTADPLHPAANAMFLPQNQFPAPLAVTWAETKGADLSWVPIAFANSFRMDYSRTHYGTGYYIYAQYSGGAKLSQPLTNWSEKFEPPADVLKLFERAGTDLFDPLHPDTMEGVFSIAPNSTNFSTLFDNGPAELRKLVISAPLDHLTALGKARLRVAWDGRRDPSIDTPLTLFFGAGTLYNRDNRPYLVRAFPVSIHYGATNVEMSCYFPMPYFKSMRFEILGGTNGNADNVHVKIYTEPFNEPPASVGYFHATYRDHPKPVMGRDLVLLDTRETEGGGDWSGNFVGTSFVFSDRANLATLEGDPRFFFDDSQTPQGQGTGTEEWGGGGDYWGGVNMTLPFAGHPTGAAKPSAAKCDEDKIESAYRFLLGDLMPFGRNARICLEHGGTDESREHYQTVTYWYGAPAAALVKTDEVKIGDAASEVLHQYISPDASAPYSITSRYEWGVDTVKGAEIYPAITDAGRKTAGTSEFTIRLTPENFGVLLRRKLDYSYLNQCAEVSIGDETGHWLRAGRWYLAGANTCVYSNPKGELGAAQHMVEASNRRFRDDEFLISRDLTAGKKSIRVRIKFVPMNIPLFPGRPMDEQAWSEIRYDAYCYVMPNWKPARDKF
jgi:hypothetical protein